VLKSILRYPGGKSRGVNEICNLIPSNTKILFSPFLGGGSIEIACANNGISVFGFDNFKPLVEFWECLLKDPIKLANIVKKYYPLPKSTFYELQKKLPSFKTKFERGAIFYVLNRSSFSGTTLSGGMSPNHERFTLSSIDRLINFKLKNLEVKQADFHDSIDLAQDELMYVDPPYLINQSLYGTKGNLHKGFDHLGLSKLLKNKVNWILSYNNSEEILKLYEDYYIYSPKWTYGMSQNKTSREVLILSHNVAKRNNLS
jgi:DNA adenine methylase